MIPPTNNPLNERPSLNSEDKQFDLENKLYSLIDQIRTNEIEQAQQEGRAYKIHGLCAVLGYDPKLHAQYFTIPVGKDLFDDNNSDNKMYVHDLQALPALQQAMEIDGAILINSEGKIMHSGRYMQADLGIYSRHQAASATYQKLRETVDAGTRHLAAIALSAQLSELSFYTLRSDRPQLQVFKDGSIVRSSIVE